MQPLAILIEQEILSHGPVQASIAIYEDLLVYRQGVYRHVTGREVSMGTVKIIGWGIEDNTPYWLCANSWNDAWGDKGYFKILKGHQECDIEKHILAGEPTRR